MALDKNQLSEDIKTAILNSNNAINSSNLPQEQQTQILVKQLADQIADAIHSYVTKADVNISQVTSTSETTVSVTTSGGNITTKGHTDSPVVVKHKNTGKLQ